MPDVDLQIDVVKSTAAPALARLVAYLVGSALRRHVGKAVTVFTQAHLRSLLPNKMGWPSQRFYQKCADGTAYEVTEDGVRVTIDNPEAPGALKHQYNRGQSGTTTISMKDKLLTIPARAEFYGHRAGEFANLRYVQFASGAKALVIGRGGAELVNFATGKSSSKGIGARSAMMVAYWLAESVTQQAKPEVLPTRESYMNVVHAALNEGIAQLAGGNN